VLDDLKIATPDGNVKVKGEVCFQSSAFVMFAELFMKFSIFVRLNGQSFQRMSHGTRRGGESEILLVFRVRSSSAQIGILAVATWLLFC